MQSQQGLVGQMHVFSGDFSLQVSAGFSDQSQHLMTPEVKVQKGPVLPGAGMNTGRAGLQVLKELMAHLQATGNFCQGQGVIVCSQEGEDGVQVLPDPQEFQHTLTVEKAPTFDFGWSKRRTEAETEQPRFTKRGQSSETGPSALV